MGRRMIGLDPDATERAVETAVRLLAQGLNVFEAAARTGLTPSEVERQRQRRMRGRADQEAWRRLGRKPMAPGAVSPDLEARP